MPSLSESRAVGAALGRELTDGAELGADDTVGVEEGIPLTDGCALGIVLLDGAELGPVDGAAEASPDGLRLGTELGWVDGIRLGAADGPAEGLRLGWELGPADGSCACTGRPRRATTRRNTPAILARLYPRHILLDILDGPWRGDESVGSSQLSTAAGLFWSFLPAGEPPRRNGRTFSSSCCRCRGIPRRLLRSAAECLPPINFCRPAARRAGVSGPGDGAEVQPLHAAAPSTHIRRADGRPLLLTWQFLRRISCVGSGEWRCESASVTHAGLGRIRPRILDRSMVVVCGVYCGGFVGPAQPPLVCAVLDDIGCRE